MSRRTETYRGVQLVAAIYEGKFQGKAWGPKLGSALAHVEGDSIDDVLGRLRYAVDSPAVQDTFRARLIEKHEGFLREHGIDPSTISAEEIVAAYDRSHRTTGCYNCKSGLDNEIDVECPRCGWIICTGCGACGCGHPKHGVKVTERIRRQKTMDASRQEFRDFAAARDYALSHPPALVKRNQSGDGWVVQSKRMKST